jgi:hypothetical protein
MTVSVEVSHISIIKQLDSLKQAHKRLFDLKKNVSIDRLIKDIYDRLYEIDKIYVEHIGPYIAHFYDVGLTEPYWDFVLRNGILSKLNGCSDDIVIAAHFCHTNVDDLEKNTIVVPTKKSDDFCVCGKAMVVDEAMSRKVCCVCGVVERIDGMKYVDTMASVADQFCVKSGRHHPNVHCRLWTGRLQAWDTNETKKFDCADAVEYLRKCVERDGLPKNLVSCRKVREYLKLDKRTSFNNIIPYLRKIAIGVVPPQMTVDELDLSYDLFDKVVCVLKKLRPNNNITYYPYIILKIWAGILPNGERKNMILECIHIQTNKTTVSIDLIWESVCENIDGLKYMPTIS